MDCKKVGIIFLMFSMFFSIFAFFAFAMDVSVIAINYKYDFIVIDKGYKHGIEDGTVFYILKNAFQIGKVQVRKSQADVAACDVIGLVEGAELELGEKIALVSEPVTLGKKVKYRWKDITPPEEKKEKETTTIAEFKTEEEEPEARELQEKQFAILQAKARELAKKEIEEKKKLLVTFNFKNADISNVLRIISREKKMNIIAGGDIQGEVTANFENVSVYKALDAILQSLGYTYIKEDGIIKVLPLSEGEFNTRYYVYQPKHIKVTDLNESIGGILSNKGKILLDEVANQMMIIDTPSNLERIKKFIEKLDELPKQVMIEAKVIDVRLTDNKSSGVEWHALKPLDTIEERLNMSFTDEGLSVLKYGTIRTTQLDILVSALREKNTINVISEPSITTLNNKPATIKVEGKLAYREWEEEDTETAETRTYTWQEKDTGITLNVTPSITSDDVVRMLVEPTTKDLQEWLPEPESGYEKGYPVITTREVKAEVLVPEGETLVIGGLIKESKIEMSKGVPGLSNIPILGILFRTESVDLQESELMIFITPHIVKNRIEKE